MVRQALAEAGQTYQSVDAIAVTQGPGLAGALLVGISFAKALAFALEKPLIAVNHLEGHIHAVLLEQRQSRSEAELHFPVLALVVSGGHTHLYLARGCRKISGPTGTSATLATTLRARRSIKSRSCWGWAIREGRSSTGWRRMAIRWRSSSRSRRSSIATGAITSERSKKGDLQQPDHAPTEEAGLHFDFSYSGIKTAVLRYVETENLKPAIEARRQALAEIGKPALEDVLGLCDRQTLNLVASFQRTMVNDLVTKTLAAAREYEVQTLFVSGGVAANRELRATFEREAGMQGLPVFFPARALSTDNAAMIAAAAFPKFLRREFVAMDFSAEAGMPLR